MTRIECGDIVNVSFNCSQYTLSPMARVINVPMELGASWIFECLDTGTVAHVSEGCTVVKLEVSDDA